MGHLHGRHRGDLSSGRGLDGLQTTAILSAAPFVLIMVGMCYSLFKALRSERVLGVENPREREPYQG